MCMNGIKFARTIRVPLWFLENERFRLDHFRKCGLPKLLRNDE